MSGISINEHSFAGDPTSLYNLTKSDPDPSSDTNSIKSEILFPNKASSRARPTSFAAKGLNISFIPETSIMT